MRRAIVSAVGVLTVSLLGGVTTVAFGQSCIANTETYWANGDGAQYGDDSAACGARSRVVDNGYMTTTETVTSDGPFWAGSQYRAFCKCAYHSIIDSTGQQAGSDSTADQCAEVYQWTQPCPPISHFLKSIAVPKAEVCSNDCVHVHDPINPGIGNVYATEQDVAPPGISGLSYTRYYNSADLLGADRVPGWRHSYSRSIVTVNTTTSSAYPGQSATVSPEYATPHDACVSGFPTIQSSVPAWASATVTYTNNVCVVTSGSAVIGTTPIQSTPIAWGSGSGPVEYDIVRDDGQILRYTMQNGSPTAPPGVSLRLAVTSSGFTVTDDQDTVESYNAAGMLQSITTRAGVVQTLSYDTSAHFSGVTDNFGNSLTVTRNSFGSIATLTLNGGATVQYGYDPYYRLVSVTNLDGTVQKYAYGDSRFSNALTAKIDEAGVTYSTWAYDAQERALSTQEYGGAGAGTLTYNPDGTVSDTDALGAVRVFSYGRVGDINKVVSISGSQCPTCEESAATTYDTAGFVASRADYNGNLTCYASDPTRGLELVRVEGFAPGSTCPANLATYIPVAGTAQRKISTTWHGTYRLPVQIVEPTRTTTFGYDSAGNLLTRAVADTTVSPNVSRTWTYTYNSFGQVLTAQGPRTDVNSTTAYTYYSCTSGSQCGQVHTVTDAVGHI